MPVWLEVTLCVMATLVALLAIIQIVDSTVGEKILALMAARRIGLRDRGRMGRSEDGGYFAHAFCRTPLRIGIDDDLNAKVVYCWRCEDCLDTDDPDPKDRDDIPVVKESPVIDGNKVVRLADFRKAS